MYDTVLQVPGLRQSSEFVREELLQVPAVLQAFSHHPPFAVHAAMFPPQTELVQYPAPASGEVMPVLCVLRPVVAL